MTTHPCGAEGCHEACPESHFMCVRHWRMVPKALRDTVHAAWRKYRRFARSNEERLTNARALQRVHDEAIAAVREKEIRTQLKKDEHQPSLLSS